MWKMDLVLDLVLVHLEPAPPASSGSAAQGVLAEETRRLPEAKPSA